VAKLVVARLGSIEFSVPEGTFTAVARHTTWRLDLPDPMEGLGRPVSRGRGSDEITIDGLVFPGHTGTLASVQRLREAGDAGESMLLVDGEGNLYGNWFIARLNERKGPFLPTGIERRAEWTLTLNADPDDEAVI
jgi:phage protein U